MRKSNVINTPLAIFAYNRADHVRQLLESVARCYRFEECSVHIFCDGPKNAGDIPSVERSRSVVRVWAERHKSIVVERDQNLGLARSIVLGVSELCDRYGRVIVVEDDLVLSPDFLDYMLRGLDAYENEERVYQISGYMFPTNHAAELHAFFLPLTTTWGWATWARAWKHFDWCASEALQMLKDKHVRKRFDAEGCYPFTAMLKNRLAGKNDSWGILWWWAVFRHQGLVLYPHSSLVWVGGFDCSGTHCGAGGFSQRPVHEFRQKVFSGPINYPDNVGFEPDRYVKTVQKMKGSRIGGLKRLMSQALRRLS